MKEKNTCTGCMACVAVCPKNCISVIYDDEGFAYPCKNELECIYCQLCASICPTKKNFAVEVQSDIAYAVVNKDEEARRNSSSGGFFTLIAYNFIKNGGVVYGAAFKDDMYSVEHIKVDRTEDLHKLQGSKYLQSSIQEIFFDIKTALDSNIPVLFSGTPCQIAGVKSFLGSEYAHLYLVDFICHGVPSPLVWRKYIQSIENKVKSKVIKASFRDKSKGWNRYSLRLEFKNGKRYLKSRKEDLYLRGFIKNLFLRPSCYACNFKGIRRASDLTMADFWGVEDVDFDINDNQGVSLILINSEKGRFLFGEVVENCVNKKISFEAGTKRNSAIIDCAFKPKGRTSFMEQLNNYPIDRLLKKHCGITLKEQAKRLFKAWISLLKGTFKDVLY